MFDGYLCLFIFIFRGGGCNVWLGLNKRFFQHYLLSFPPDNRLLTIDLTFDKGTFNLLAVKMDAQPIGVTNLSE